MEDQRPSPEPAPRATGGAAPGLAPAPAPPADPTPRDLVATAGLVLALVALFHGPSLRNGFTYDDRWTIVDSPVLREPGNLLAQLGGEGARRGLPDAGRPALLATEMLDHALWGLDPFGYHLQNLVWHAATAVALLAGVAHLARSSLLGFAAAALFAVHPLNVEAVAAINYREDSIAAFSALAALLAIGAARRARRRRGAALAIAFTCTTVGVFAKESAVVAPALLVALDFCLGISWRRPALRARLAELGVLLLPALAATLWRAWAIGGVGVVSRTAELDPDLSRVDSIARGAVAFAASLAALAWPAGLSPAYQTPGGPLALVAAVAAIAGMALVALRARRHAPLVAAGLLGGLVAWIPTSGLVPITNPRADRYFYLPSAWLLAGLVLAVLPALQRLRWMRGPPLFDVPRVWLTVSAVAVLLGARTLRQGRIWRSDVALWTHATRVAPGSSLAWRALAETRLRLGQTVAALEAVRTSLAIDDDAHARQLHGVILMQQGAWELACRELGRALGGAEPHHRAEALNNLGSCEIERGRPRDALPHLEEAIRTDPHLDRAWLNAARAHEKLGDLARARATLRALVEAIPESADARRELRRLENAAPGSGEQAGPQR